MCKLNPERKEQLPNTGGPCPVSALQLLNLTCKVDSRDTCPFLSGELLSPFAWIQR